MHQGKHQEYEKRLHDAMQAQLGLTSAGGAGSGAGSGNGSSNTAGPASATAIAASLAPSTAAAVVASTIAPSAGTTAAAVAAATAGASTLVVNGSSAGSAGSGGGSECVPRSHGGSGGFSNGANGAGNFITTAAAVTAKGSGILGSGGSKSGDIKQISDITNGPIQNKDAWPSLSTSPLTTTGSSTGGGCGSSGSNKENKLNGKTGVCELWQGQRSEHSASLLLLLLLLLLNYYYNYSLLLRKPITRKYCVKKSERECTYIQLI